MSKSQATAWRQGYEAGESPRLIAPRNPYDATTHALERLAWYSGLDSGTFGTKDATNPYTTTDTVDHPDHYNQHDIECIEVVEMFSFTLGNAIKYIWRAGFKGDAIEDLRKAVWYIEREISRREKDA